MSEYVRNKKTLTLDVRSIELIAEAVVKNIPKWCDSKLEEFTSCPEDYGYCIIDKNVYSVVNHEVDNEPDYCNIRCMGAGVFEIETYHYSASAHWTELLEGKLP